MSVYVNFKTVKGKSFKGELSENYVVSFNGKVSFIKFSKTSTSAVQHPGNLSHPSQLNETAWYPLRFNKIILYITTYCISYVSDVCPLDWFYKFYNSMIKFYNFNR
jgi:hypothetical protein